MATIFTSEEGIHQDKISAVNHILSSTEAGFEEILQSYLNSNFPKKNKKIHEISFDEAIVKFLWYDYEPGLEKGIYFDIRIDFDSENSIVCPGDKEQSSTQIYSRKIRFSSLTGQDGIDVLDKFKNKKSIMSIGFALKANVTVDSSQGSEKTITWKFQQPRDEGIYSEFGCPLRMHFHYSVARNKPLREHGLCDSSRNMFPVLEWENLQKTGRENTKKAIQIMASHFKDWSADEKKESRLKRPEQDDEIMDDYFKSWTKAQEKAITQKIITCAKSLPKPLKRIDTDPETYLLLE